MTTLNTHAHIASFIDIEYKMFCVKSDFYLRIFLLCPGSPNTVMKFSDNLFVSILFFCPRMGKFVQILDEGAALATAVIKPERYLIYMTFTLFKFK